MASYRGINPKPTFDSPNHPLVLQQFLWAERSEGLQTALYAGKEMMICVDEGDTYRLTYMDFAHPELFASIDSAKDAADDFARAVLLRMLEYVGVRFEDQSLRQCLTLSGA